MLARLNLRMAVRMTAVAASLIFCAGATLARAPSRVQATLSAPVAPAVEGTAPPSRLDSSEPTRQPLALPAQPLNGEPFGVAATDSGSYSTRWHILQPLIRLERQMLALCRSDSSTCTPAAAKFGAVVEAARPYSGRARVGVVNRAVNLAIRPMIDLAQYGFPDIWASPLMTFGSGAGDCKDYAIAKYVALRETGISPDDLRLVVVYNHSAHEGHMVAAARIDGRWLILDNRTMRLVADDDIADLTPLAVLDSGDSLPTIATNPSVRPAHASTESSEALGFPVDL